MIINRIKQIGVVVVLFLSSLARASDGEKVHSLSELFEDKFLIGAALNKDQILGHNSKATKVLKYHFNSATAENEMKWEKIQPLPGQYTFEVADALIELGETHGHKIIGHTLLWHNQTPAWVFENERGHAASREELLRRLRDHIQTVVGRYKGKVHGWDVVNEAFNDDGTWRITPWQEIIGSDYIEKAFEYANAVDPEAELYYNDYNLFIPTKREAVARLVNTLKEKGIRIDAVGMQGHYGFQHPKLTDLQDSIAVFAAADVKVMITELDVSVLPSPLAEGLGADITLSFENSAKWNPYPDSIPSTIERKQADRYRELFDVFNEWGDEISRVTFWGIGDDDSWKNDWPIDGRTDYPLLFDRSYEPKAAFHSISELAID